MSLAIKFGDDTDETSISGAIYFDVVTNYTKNYTGKVTEHPIEAGASVSDHYISNNPRYSVSGVISHVDFSTIPSILLLDGQNVINNEMPPQPIIISDALAGLEKIIPGVISQFMTLQKPSVTSPSAPRSNKRGEIEKPLKDLMNGLFYNEKRQRWENRMTPITLFELNGLMVENPINNLICTSIQIKEDDTTGDALFFDMQFEQVRFVTLVKVEAPKPQPKTATARATADKSNKGNQTASVNDPTNPPKEPEAPSTFIGEVKAGLGLDKEVNNGS